MNPNGLGMTTSAMESAVLISNGATPRSTSKHPSALRARRSSIAHALLEQDHNLTALTLSTKINRMVNVAHILPIRIYGHCRKSRDCIYYIPYLYTFDHFNMDMCGPVLL